jgi:hypothetical protein
MVHAIGVVVAFVLAAATAQPQAITSMAGRYTITAGAVGTVEIAPALGGSFQEVRVVFTDVPHELRYLVATEEVGGSHSIWRFEGDPAPAVQKEGTARFEGGELIAEFPHTTRNPAQVFRERWKVSAAGQLEFVLEAGSVGKATRRIGSFTASRQ